MLGRNETRTRESMYCHGNEQLETSPETIEQEKHRQTDIFKENYSIDCSVFPVICTSSQNIAFPSPIWDVFLSW